MANVVVSALATWNGKALKKAKSDVSVFDKQLKSLARTFGITFSAAAVISFSKKAISAFSKDEAAAKSLAVQLENTGNAFRVGEVEAYISSLQTLYGVLDDQLRPAFQTLLNATGSVTLSQRALETALNTSAGTGIDLATVVAAIAKGASGTTTALVRLNTGLDKSIIAGGDMNKIMAALDKRFAGQAAARLTTYAGKMDLLQVASANATEIIGKGLVDALSVLSEDNSIASLAESMENLATNTANATVALAKLLKQFSDFTSSPTFKPAILALALLTRNPKIVVGVMGGIAGSEALGVATKDFGPKELPANQKRSASRLELKAIKDGVFFRKQENDQLKKKTEIDKLKDKFDLERIGLTAALNFATDEETKLRIRAQLAILDNNEALAKKILAEMDSTAAMRAAADSAKRLAEAAGLASAALYALANRPNPIVSMSGELTARGQNQIPSDAGFIVPPSATGGSNTGTTIINTTVNTGTIIGEEDLTTLIADKIRLNLKYGNKLVPAGSIS
jgi:hypothetical protein